MSEGNSTCLLSSFILWEAGNKYLANDLALSSVNGFSAVLALICNLAIAVVMKTKQLIKIPCHTLIFSLTLVDSVAVLVARPLYIALRLVLHYNQVTCYSLERLAKIAESTWLFLYAYGVYCTGSMQCPLQSSSVSVTKKEER